MGRFPTIKAKQLIKALQHLGFYIDRQEGSHVILTNGDRIIVVPLHTKDLGRGITKSIIKDANLRTEDILEVL